MNSLVQQIADGTATGLIYASVALALVMIYKSTHQINFAQGEMAVFSTYLALTAISLGLPYWIAFTLAVVISFVGGTMIERLLIRPLANAPSLNVVIVFIGLFAITNSLTGWIWGFNIKTFPSPFAGAQWYSGGYLSQHQVGMAGLILVELAGIFAFFSFTSLGLRMRAAAENPVSSRLSGIRVNRMISIGWGLAAAIGAIAGILTAPLVFLDPNMMSGVLIYGFAGALLGGLESPGGAVAGGIIVGIVEALAGAYFVGSELKLTLALVVIIVVLMVRPAGLFGRTFTNRV